MTNAERTYFVDDEGSDHLCVTVDGVTTWYDGDTTLSDVATSLGLTSADFTLLT